jgi:hypothetical protein
MTSPSEHTSLVRYSRKSVINWQTATTEENKFFLSGEPFEGTVVSAQTTNLNRRRTDRSIVTVPALLIRRPEIGTDGSTQRSFIFIDRGDRNNPLQLFEVNHEKEMRKTDPTFLINRISHALSEEDGWAGSIELGVSDTDNGVIEFTKGIGAVKRCTRREPTVRRSNPRDICSFTFNSFASVSDRSGLLDYHTPADGWRAGDDILDGELTYRFTSPGKTPKPTEVAAASAGGQASDV